MMNSNAGFIERLVSYRNTGKLGLTVLDLSLTVFVFATLNTGETLENCSASFSIINRLYIWIHKYIFPYVFIHSKTYNTDVFIALKHFIAQQ